MSQYTQEQLSERLKKLPTALKEALFSVEIANKLFDIGKKNGLTIEEIGLMAGETGNIITGLTRPEEFIKILGETLYALEEDEVKKIASDINRDVLLPLRDLLKSAHNFGINSVGNKIPDGIKDSAEPKSVPTFMKGLGVDVGTKEERKKPELVIHPEPQTSMSVKTPAPVGFGEKTSQPEGKPSMLPTTRHADIPAVVPSSLPVNVPNIQKRPEPPANLPVQPMQNSKPSLTIDLSARREKPAPPKNADLYREAIE